MAKKKLSDERIPDDFRKGTRPRVRTVGELIAELQQLPPELPLEGGLGDNAARVIVTNVNDKYLAVMIDFDNSFGDDE